MAVSDEKVKLYQIEDILFSDIKQTPNTLAGYGITNALTTAQSDSRYVRYDVEQSLSPSQQEQARDNIGVVQGEFHDPVTLGVPNGLYISQQVLSLALASTVNPGAMSVEDKIKLNGIAPNANNYSHPTQAVLDSGNLTGKNVISRIAFNSFGHVTTIDTRTNLPYVDFTSAETITGLKTIRRAGPNVGGAIANALRFEIADDDLYKMFISTNQNDRTLNGEVNWFFRMREAYTDGVSTKGVTFDRLGFHKGGITVIGGYLPSDDLGTEIDTWINDEYVSEAPFTVSTYIKRDMMVEGRGYFGKDDFVDTLFLTSNDTLYSAGTVYAAKGLRTADADNPTTVFDGSVVFLGNVTTTGPGGATHKMRIRHNGNLYDVALTAV